MREDVRTGLLGAWMTAALGAPGAAQAAEVNPQLFLGASLVIGFGDGVHPGVAVQTSNEWLIGDTAGLTAGPWVEARWVATRGFSVDVGTRIGAMLGDRSDCREWRPVGGFGLDTAAHFGRGGPAFRLGATGAGATIAAGGFSVLTDGDGWRDPSAHVGVRVPLVPQCFYVIGRPLRDGPGRAVATAFGPSGAPAQAWLARGREEHEAVGTFVRLAAELRALGAPAPLIAAAERAAAEEVGHALVSYALAAARGGGPVGVRPLTVPGRAIGSRTDAIARLAVEALLDGVVGEGHAADRSEAAAGAGAARERAAEEKIAVEERTHAAIGDATIAWALREAPAASRTALAAVEASR